MASKWQLESLPQYYVMKDDSDTPLKERIQRTLTELKILLHSFFARNYTFTSRAVLLLFYKKTTESMVKKRAMIFLYAGERKFSKRKHFFFENS